MKHERKDYHSYMNGFQSYSKTEIRSCSYGNTDKQNT